MHAQDARADDKTTAAPVSSVVSVVQANLNHLWAGLIVEELVRNDIDFFCLAPGSRSTPLTTAVARHPKARHVMHFDERGTAFCALGYARATGRPAAWITTSGTAVANGMPAVVEAASDSVPLLLLTADRPPELRETGVNQTIDQVKFFGDYVRWQFDLPTPSRDVEPAAVLTMVDQAAYRARRVPAGPVHLNCMFRKPLHPVPDGQDYSDYVAGLTAWQRSIHPYTRYARSEPAVDLAAIEPLYSELQAVERGLVVAGRLAKDVDGGAIVRLASALGWPLLCEVTSQLRLGVAGDGRIGYHEAILGSPAFRRAHRAEAVIHLGGFGPSKRLLEYLDACRPRPFVVVHESPTRLDPKHQATHRFEARPSDFCRALADLASSARTDATGWHAAWEEANRRVAERLASLFEEPEMLSEPSVAHALTRHLPDDHGLCLASSMPVRDVGHFAAPGAAAPVATNRGASGIDGTVATAVGFAYGLGRPVTLLIGDLALLHDLNSLALLRALPVPVVILVLNNNGGGIFHFLPIAAHHDVFEPFFGTPHGLTFESAAALFGLAYHRATTADGFTAAYREACGHDGPTLIEVPTDRTDNHVLHEQLREVLAAAVDKT